MFEQVTVRLLQGDFLCESTAPEAFRWLNRHGAREEVDAYLNKIGRKLSATSNQQAYYATWKKVGQTERAEVKRVFLTIQQTLRPVLSFLKLCMEAHHSDSSPAPGENLEYPALLKAVADSPHLLEELRKFGTMGKEFTVTDASAKGMLDKIIQQLEKSGYLMLSNKDQASYRFTGKLDYYYQVLDFLSDNMPPESAEDEQEPTPVQGVLT